MAVPAHETCRGIYTSSTNHVAVVLGPPRNAVGAATLGRDSTWNPKTNCREAIRGLMVEQHLSHHAAPGGALRQGHARRAQHPGNTASGSERGCRAVEIRKDRAQATGATLGARSLSTRVTPHGCFPAAGRCSDSMSFVSEVSRSENDDSPGESLSERSPGTGFLMRLIRL